MENPHQLRPGQQTEVVVEVDETAERIDVRKSIIYDVVDSRVIVAQTDRPLSRYDIDRKVTLTALSRDTDEQVRCGYPARIRELMADYRLASNKSVRAVALDTIGAPTTFNLRMHYRVQPGLDSGVAVHIQGAEVGLFDISLGGARILLKEDLRSGPGTVVSGRLSLDGRDHDVRFRILKTWEHLPPSSARRSDPLSFATIQFISLKKETERELSRKIRHIERIRRQKELDFRADGEG